MKNEQCKLYLNLIEDYVAKFASIVEKKVIKYKKNIIDNQILLNSICDISMYLYTMIIITTRLDKSIELSLRNNNYENDIVNFWINHVIFI
ncbi:hypothetical protein A3Q56_07482 [Intoshia linei]|uniref:ACAD9/ACADV-like C-terminal domain-containing protein n=1 Tax=Intoshia linei TaxID=1819745 RepID=A0A177ARQ9_9BILA|nr:hypothetical protein A3Q56_07482 [Intoshia linei]